MIDQTIKCIEEGISELFPVNSFIVDENGKLVWVNNNLLKLSDVTSFDQLKGKHIRIFGEESWQTTLKVIQSGNAITLYEEVDGKKYLVIKTPYKMDGMCCVLGMSIDITAIHKAEIAKQAFVMNMSHDLLTPITGIIGSAEYLLNKPQDEKTKEFLGYIRDSSLELLNVHKKILEVNNNAINQDHFIGFSVRELLLEIQRLYISTIKSKGLRLDIICEPGIVNTNWLRLKQILLNLVSNAVKFTEKGFIEIVVIESKKMLVIQVKDTGIGIDKSKHEYVFKNFTKIKPSYKNSSFEGSGIGLYLVKQAVEELKGTISLTSSLGEGATFQIEIPLLATAVPSL